MVNKLTAGRTTVGRVRRQPPPGKKSAHVLNASAEAFFTPVWQN
ncbi:hypothetical protein [Klebsiella pneumoniae IS46]|nr:hypothetical protein [Klebsiella pneumoniae IS46]